MPIYNYRCNGCRKHFERILRMADIDSPQKCGECKTARKVVRVVTNAGPYRINGNNSASTSPRGASLRRNK